MNCQYNLRLRLPFYYFNSVRWKQFKVKRNWSAPGSKKKNACDLALEYFDFAYAPIYGRHWPSIRLALLSDSKYCAVINTLTPCQQAIEKLRLRGAVDMLDIVKNFKGKLPRKTNSNIEILNSSNNMQQHLEGDPVKVGNEEVDETNHIKAPSDVLSPQALQMRELYGLLGEGEDEEDMRLTTTVHDIPTIDEAFTISCELTDALKIMVYPRGDISTFPKASVSKEGAICWYLMDAASILPVLALNIKYGDSVLDLCAAPGGKSLVAFMTRRPGMLVCNDSKTDRLNRLRSMLLKYVPDDARLRNRIIMKRKDAITDWDEFEAYDRVLVDVPCTSDRLSVLQEEGNIFKISPERTKDRSELPVKQTKILINGLRSLRPGGTLVYSTCSLSPQQNEGVVKEAISTLFQLHNINVRICNLQSLEHAFGRSGFFRFQKRAQPGSLALPFLPINHGPLYFCKIQRLP